MKTMIVLIAAVLAQATGNTLLSKAMKQIGTAGGDFSLSLLTQAVGSPMIWAGTLFLIAFFALFAASLTWEDLSFVLPATASGYILNLAFACYFLDESVSPKRWVGTLLICLGVILVSRTGSKAYRQEH